jgi:hypothetical protein
MSKVRVLTLGHGHGSVRTIRLKPAVKTEQQARRIGLL